MLLSKKEAMLLKLLVENKNEVVPREKILQSVWGYNVYPTTRTIDNFILNFRKYFEIRKKHGIKPSTNVKHYFNKDKAKAYYKTLFNVNLQIDRVGNIKNGRFDDIM